VTTTDNIGSKITLALKAGSGVDINDLATTLAEAESMASIRSVTAKKEAAEVSISGFGVLKAAVTALKSGFDGLKDRDTLMTKSVSSDNPNTIEAEISSQSLARAGTTRIVVHQIARPEVTEIKTAAEGTFASADASISGLTSITLGSNGSSSVITIGTATPAGMVEAINNANFNGIQARAVNKSASGTAVTVVLEGKTGSANSFTVDTNLSGGSELTFQQDQSAANLQLEVNADKISAADSNPQMTERDNNSPSDVVEGVQIIFKSANATATRKIVVSANTATLETKLESLVSSYNDFITITDYLTGDEDPDDSVAGSLSSERGTLNSVKNTVRGFLNMTSTTASNGIGTLRDIGITTKLGGQIALDKTLYSAVVKTNFSDVRTMLTADANDQIAADAAANGLALDASVILDAIVKDPSGTITTREANVAREVTQHEERLLDLQERMEGIKARYLRQFAAMETLVQRSKNTGDYLTSQFKAMEGMYSND
jgi:flagellar hook-associated protein 2